MDWKKTWLLYTSQDIKEITSKYEELILSDNSTEDLLNGLSEISNENFDKCILENENARVTVRVQSENKYIAVSDTIVAVSYTHLQITKTQCCIGQKK